MPPVKNVEKKIWDIEGFDVVLRGSDGHDVRGDRRGLPQYPYDRAAKNDMTVEAWKARRFRPTYPGFDVDVVGEGPLAGQPPSGVQLIDVGNRFRVVHAPPLCCPQGFPCPLAYLACLLFRNCRFDVQSERIGTRPIRAIEGNPAFHKS